MTGGIFTSTWQCATTPPPGQVGLWSTRVVVMTNFGNVNTISYYRGEDGKGIWQRLSCFAKNEVVVLWAELPDLTKLGL